MRSWLLWLRKIRTPDAAARARRVGGELFWVMVGQAAAALGAIAGVRLMTQVLDPRAYGELALGMATAALVHQSVLAPLSGGGLRFFAAAQENHSLHSFFRAIAALIRRSTLVLVAIFLLLIVALVFMRRGPWIPLCVASFLFALFVGYAVVLDGFQNAARQRTVVALHDALNQWLRFLLGFLLAMFVARTSTMAMIGYASGATIVLVSQALFFKFRLLPFAGTEEEASTPQSEWEQRVTRYAWPIGIWGIFYWAQAASDRWALEFAKSVQDVGLYAVVYQLGYYPITMLTGLVVQLVSPIVFARAGDASDAVRLQNSRRFNRKVLAAVAALTVIAFAAGAALRRVIFSIFAAPAYGPFSAFLPWLILSGGIFAAGQVASLSIMAEGETQRLLIPRVVTAVIGVALNFAGAFLRGVPGVIAAGIFTNAAFLVWAFALLRQPIDVTAAVVPQEPV